jgi:hypothetical protein
VQRGEDQVRLTGHLPAHVFAAPTPNSNGWAMAVAHSEKCGDAAQDKLQRVQPKDITD